MCVCVCVCVCACVVCAFMCVCVVLCVWEGGGGRLGLEGIIRSLTILVDKIFDITGNSDQTSQRGGHFYLIGI